MKRRKNESWPEFEARASRKHSIKLKPGQNLKLEVKCGYAISDRRAKIAITQA